MKILDVIIDTVVCHIIRFFLTIDDKIRNHKNYKFIKVSYEDIMALFNEKVAKIIQDPQNLSFSR